jgi:serine/threonine protein kinase
LWYYNRYYKIFQSIIFNKNEKKVSKIKIFSLKENQNDNKYLLVMEYANNGTLRNYLSENFKNLTWNNKINLAFQLASAISFLHDKDIVHRDLIC